MCTVHEENLKTSVQRALTGFAGGVMVAASVWSLLIPALEMSEEKGGWAFISAVSGFWIGILFLLFLDHLIPHMHQNAQQAEGPKTKLKRTTMLVLAVTLHNILEGAIISMPLRSEVIWCFVRYCRAHRSDPDHSGSRIYCNDGFRCCAGIKNFFNGYYGG